MWQECPSKLVHVWDEGSVLQTLAFWIEFLTKPLEVIQIKVASSLWSGTGVFGLMDYCDSAARTLKLGLRSVSDADSRTLSKNFLYSLGFYAEDFSRRIPVEPPAW